MTRSTSTRRWWVLVLVLLGLPAPAGALTITEIHYLPPAGGPDLRFVEVFNDASTVADLSGHYFSNGIVFTFPEGTYLPGRSYLVVCADEDAVRTRYGIANTLGNFTLNLDPDGETLAIANASGIELVEVSYRDRGRWPSVPLGTGHTLSLRAPFLDPDDAESWAPSLEMGGTPGRGNFPPPDVDFEEREIIRLGEDWRYRKGTVEFSTPRSAWRTAGFVPDASWLLGPTGIGYGDNDDATVLADMAGNYISIAARKTFTLTADQIAGMEELVLLINYDDGFIAWLNGTESARSFLGNPGEDTPFDAPAASHEAVGEEAFPIPVSRLVVGTNVLAVQVHNTDRGSSDASCSPRLVSRRALDSAPRLVLNELLGRTAGERWVEIHNPGSSAVEAGGWLLSDDPTDLGRHVLAAGAIPAGGFRVLTEAQTGLSFSGAEVVLTLTLPDGSRVMDARVFENGPVHRAGVSDARFPDGSGEWVFAATPTPGAPNQLVVEPDLVINEIQYNPFESRNEAAQPFEPRPGEFIEIHNRGERTISLEGFALTRGVDYVFGPEAEIGPGGYLVVAEDPAWMASTYGLAGVLGPWEGGLQNDGEAIRLEDPLGNTVDEVRYAEGGDWPELADGNGSTLELIDPRQDNSAGPAWEPSDERGKSAWTQLSYTASYSPVGESVFHFTPIQDGSFLLDDVEIVRSGIAHVPNGGFETSTAGWVFEGALMHSRRITTESRSGAACLEVIATSGGDMRMNRLALPTTPVMIAGNYTVRFWARWLHGGNLILAHAFDNTLSRALWLPVPRDLGTPGRENGATARLRAAAGEVNLGPVVQGVEQRPVQPGAGQPVTVSASISDADGVRSASIFHRLNSKNGVFDSVPMARVGGGDAAGGRWSGVIPGVGAGSRVVFYIEAEDEQGVLRRYPTPAPARTLLYQVNPAVTGSLISYRLSMDEESRAELESRLLHSDDPIYGSFVFDNSEIWYNVGLHYHGSPWNRPGSPRMFKLNFPGDRPMHGARKFNISRYGSAQNEATAYYTVGRTGRPGAPTPHGDYRFVRWQVNGVDQGVMSHVETVDRDYVSRWFPTDADGLLLRANGKITFRLDGNWQLTRWAAFQYLGTDRESYRWNWDLHTRSLEDEWAPLLALMRVMDPTITPTGPAFDAGVREIFDVEEAARVLAVRVLNDDWDAIGVGNGQNAYIYYAPNEGRWKYLPWDMDHTYGNPNAGFFPASDPGITRLLSRPEFRRLFLQAMQEELDRTWNVARLSPILDAVGAAGVGNGDGIKNFINARTPLARSAIGAAGTFRIRTNNGQDVAVPGLTTSLDGDAPLAIRAILLNGEPIPGITWIQPQQWRVTVPLQAGANTFEFLGYDAEGELAGRASINVTSTFQWVAPTVSAVEPSSGPTAGGTTVTIRGTFFQPGIQVFFGTSAAASLEIVSEEELRVVTPAGLGTVEVKVQNVDRRTATVPAGFRYLGPRFVRGDATGDGLTRLEDAVAVLAHLYRGGALDCREAADANDDALVDLADAVRILIFLFSGAGPLPPPYPAADSDPTPDSLGCARN